MRPVALDIETIGLRPDDGSEIIMLSACEIGVPGAIGEIFHYLLKPKYPLTAEVSEITGLSNALLSSALSFADVVDDFLGFIAGASLVCTNAAFIRSFLNAALSTAGQLTLSRNRFHDLIDYVPTKIEGLKDVYEFFGVTEQETLGIPDFLRNHSDLEKIVLSFWKISTRGTH